MDVRAVQEDTVPRIKEFLSGRKEFEYVGNWEPCFNYAWKLPNFPYGYAMFDGNEVVGFLGTMFSERTFKGRKAIHCNIHTWVVDDEFRSRLGAAGKGAGRHLIAPLIEMKDVLITAFTPSPRSKVSCERSGFVPLDEKQVVVPLPMSFFLRTPKKSKTIRFVAAHELSEILTGEDRQIFADHKDLPCRHFLLINDSNGEYCYFIATTSEIRKLGSRFKLNNLYLCYLSNIAFFEEHFLWIKKKLWTNERVALLRYDSRLIPQQLSALKYTLPVLRLVRPGQPDLPDADDIYSELVAYNKY